MLVEPLVTLAKTLEIREILDRMEEMELQEAGQNLATAGQMEMVSIKEAAKTLEPLALLVTMEVLESLEPLVVIQTPKNQY